MYLRNLNLNSVVILEPENEELFRGSKNEFRYRQIIAEHARTHIEIFNYWGFNSFHAVKTIVRKLYPEVKEKELRELYELKVIREDVLKYVHYTYQILNV
jgi:hypothetical protein